MCVCVCVQAAFSTTNMHLFDKDARIHKYRSPEEVLESFFTLRMHYYERRKAHMLAELRAEWTRLDNKVRFILMVVDNKLVVSRKKKALLLQELQDLGFDCILPAKKGYRSKAAASDDENDNEDVDDDAGHDLAKVRML